MKFIHTSDIHLASPLSTRLPATKVTERVRELTGTLARMAKEAEHIGADGIIIAGDLFDSDKITRKQLDSALAVIATSPNVTFFYLPGNHESDVLAASGEALPQNLKIFSKGWTYFTVGNVTLAGRSETSPDMFDTLSLSSDRTNIAVLHGELRDRSAEGGIIGTKDAKEKFIDYMALGHYHTYSETVLDRRGVAVYSGAPEGRGFDEPGELGFSLIDISLGEVKHKFIPFAKRRMIIKDIDIGGLTRTYEAEARIDAALRGVSGDDIVRINFTGKRELELRCDVHFLTERYSERFYYFEIKDSSKLITRAEDYLYDKSLRGEFIRLCLDDDTLTDAEKESIIHCGLSALAGEAFDE